MKKVDWVKPEVQLKKHQNLDNKNTIVAIEDINIRNFTNNVILDLFIVK